MSYLQKVKKTMIPGLLHKFSLYANWMEAFLILLYVQFHEIRFPYLPVFPLCIVSVVR